MCPKTSYPYRSSGHGTPPDSKTKELLSERQVSPATSHLSYAAGASAKQQSRKTRRKSNIIAGVLDSGYWGYQEHQTCPRLVRKCVYANTTLGARGGHGRGNYPLHPHTQLKYLTAGQASTSPAWISRNKQRREGGYFCHYT